MDQAIKNDQNKEEGRTDLKWAMYSGHDNNVGKIYQEITNYQNNILNNIIYLIAGAMLGV